MAARFVTLDKFASETGYTKRAAEGKIHRGDWLHGREYVKAPDGRILMDMEGFNKWVVKQAAGAFAPETTA